MKSIHLPEINARYWIAISLASVFGTNLGDLYAHESGLGLLGGLWILAVLAAVAFIAERLDEKTHEFYYWFAILVIRTGATNIADYLRHSGMSPIILAIAIVALQVFLVLCIHSFATNNKTSVKRLPDTNAWYWIAMLCAGVLGTILGDDAIYLFGPALAALVLIAALGVMLMLYYNVSTSIFAYWATIAVARTAGTAVGDLLAENKTLEIGLLVSTILTGVTFVIVLFALRSHRGPVAA